MVRCICLQSGLNVFIETGTYFGDMVEAIRPLFAQVYSIEIDEYLARRAADRFARYTNVRIIQGDSSAVLPVLLRSVHEPCVFWLDAHQSGGITGSGPTITALEGELVAIRGHHPDDLILVDDAISLGRDGYPSPERVRALVGESTVRDGIMIAGRSRTSREREAR